LISGVTPDSFIQAVVIEVSTFGGPQTGYARGPYFKSALEEFVLDTFRIASAGVFSGLQGGILIQGSTTSGTIVQGNLIGLAADGSTPLGNR
jgi:hypothetical protein